MGGASLLLCNVGASNKIRADVHMFVTCISHHSRNQSKLTKLEWFYKGISFFFFPNLTKSLLLDISMFYF